MTTPELRQEIRAAATVYKATHDPHCGPQKVNAARESWVDAIQWWLDRETDQKPKSEVELVSESEQAILENISGQTQREVIGAFNDWRNHLRLTGADGRGFWGTLNERRAWLEAIRWWLDRQEKQPQKHPDCELCGKPIREVPTPALVFHHTCFDRWKSSYEADAPYPLRDSSSFAEKSCHAAPRSSVPLSSPPYEEPCEDDDPLPPASPVSKKTTVAEMEIFPPTPCGFTLLEWGITFGPGTMGGHFSSKGQGLTIGLAAKDCAHADWFCKRGCRVIVGPLLN